MTLKSKLKTFFFLDDDFDENNDEYTQAQEPVKQKRQAVKSQNVVSLQSVQKQAASAGAGTSSKASKVILVEPHSSSEVTEIADHLKSRRAVVVNLQRINHQEGRQIVDFLGGVVYALGGDIQKIGVNIFLCTPDNVEVSGNISELFSEQEDQNTRW
ncbi:MULTISPECIES: cell division protein SepF [Bacillaceae]|uniref:cell division protein SepF n=1 Tax=Bacillaceae TaxID=186817 RepID=UPI000834A54A|nr:MULTISPECIES: cell division protein SepF [Bacillaceae]MCM3768001.1 cell division protein SepF [Neobacillus niacini]